MPRPGTTARTQAEIERTIITVLLNDDHAIVPVMGALDGPEMFATPEYSRVYAAVLALLRENIVPNVYTVADRTGLALETLQDIARPYNTKASREVLYLCDIVAREHRKRSVQQALAAAQDMLAANPDDLDGYATHVMQMISTASDRKTLRDPAIAAELGETVYGGPHYRMLFVIGLVLFAITFLVNLVADIVVKGIRNEQRA